MVLVTIMEFFLTSPVAEGGLTSHVFTSRNRQTFFHLFCSPYEGSNGLMAALLMHPVYEDENLFRKMLRYSRLPKSYIELILDEQIL